MLYGLFAFGFLLLVLVTTFLINHFDLFGLRQVWLYLLGRESCGVVSLRTELAAARTLARG